MKNKPINILIPLILAVVMFLSPAAIRAASPNDNDKLQTALDELKALTLTAEANANTPALNAHSKWTRDQNREIAEKAISLYKTYPNDPRRWEAVLIMCKNQLEYFSVYIGRIGIAIPNNNKRESWHNEAEYLAAKLKTAPDVPDQIRIDFDVLLLGTAISDLRTTFTFIGDPRSGLGDPRPTPIIRSITNDYGDEKSVTGGLKNFLAHWPDYDAASLFIGYIKLPDFQKNIDTQKAVLKGFQDTPNTSVSNYIKTRLAEMDRLANLGNITFTAVDGREVNLEKLRGKVVLFYVWSTGNRSAISIHSGLFKQYKAYHGKGLEIIGISMDAAEKKDNVLAFIKDQKIPWPESFEGKARSQNPIIKALCLDGANPLFTMVLVDKRGKASFVPRSQSLEAEIKRLLSQK